MQSKISVLLWLRQEVCSLSAGDTSQQRLVSMRLTRAEAFKMLEMEVIKPDQLCSIAVARCIAVQSASHASSVPAKFTTCLLPRVHIPRELTFAFRKRMMRPI